MPGLDPYREQTIVLATIVLEINGFWLEAGAGNARFWGNPAEIARDVISLEALGARNAAIDLSRRI